MLGITPDQLVWALVGFLLVMITALAWHNSIMKAKAQAWHERQHWETDVVVKGKLERQ